MSKSKLIKKATSMVKQMGKELGKSPLGRASRGKKTRGYF